MDPHCQYPDIYIVFSTICRELFHSPGEGDWNEQFYVLSPRFILEGVHMQYSARIWQEQFYCEAMTAVMQ